MGKYTRVFYSLLYMFRSNLLETLKLHARHHERHRTRYEQGKNCLHICGVCVRDVFFLVFISYFLLLLVLILISINSGSMCTKNAKNSNIEESILWFDPGCTFFPLFYAECMRPVVNIFFFDVNHVLFPLFKR